MNNMIEAEEFQNLAWQYVQECEENTNEKMSSTGKVLHVRERKIPTINYFLLIWLSKKGKPTISRSTFYRWLKSHKDGNETPNETGGIYEAIFNTKRMFDAVAVDILANDNKGNTSALYAKNYLKWSESNKTEFYFGNENHSDNIESILTGIVKSSPISNKLPDWLTCDINHY